LKIFLLWRSRAAENMAGWEKGNTRVIFAENRLSWGTK
jgi:hypothetical protein